MNAPLHGSRCCVAVPALDRLDHPKLMPPARPQNPTIFFSQTGIPQPVAHARRRRAQAAIADRIGRSIGKWDVSGLKDLQRHLLDTGRECDPSCAGPSF
jgi:hypothetical protein